MQSCQPAILLKIVIVAVSILIVVQMLCSAIPCLWTTICWMSFCKPGIHPKNANVAFWGIFVSWELRTYGQYLFQLMQFQLDGTPKQTLLFWLARYQNQNLQKRAKQHFVFFSTSATCNLFGFNNRELAGGRNFIKRRRWWNKSQIREEPLWLKLPPEQNLI